MRKIKNEFLKKNVEVFLKKSNKLDEKQKN